MLCSQTGGTNKIDRQPGALQEVRRQPGRGTVVAAEQWDAIEWIATDREC